MNPTKILDDLLGQAITSLDDKEEIDIPDDIKSNIDTLINKIDKNKSLLSAMVTSLGMPNDESQP